MGVLSLYDSESDRLTAQASLGISRKILGQLDRLPASAVFSVAARERRRVIAEDVGADAHFEPCRALAREAGFRAVHSTPLVDRSGKVLGVLSLFFAEPHHPAPEDLVRGDLGARQAADFLENARLRDNLREAEHSKNRFLATLAHELRNPLAPIRNAVQILHMKAAPSPEVQWALEVVDRQIQKMTRLVDDLLDVARITGNTLVLRREPVDVSEVLRLAVQTCRPLIEASGQQFTLTLPHEPVFLDGDLIRLAQAVSNLLSNSSKYTERGGRITLAAEGRNGEVTITVNDTGIGIPAAILPSIFEIFTPARRSPEQPTASLGVGLSLVKRLVEMHHGTIEASSAGTGQGSQFVIRLPAVAEAPEVTAGIGGTTPGPAVSLRVLIVDDNLDAADSLALLLQLKGHETRTAHDGVEALRVAEEFHPEVTVLDLGLPKMDGYEVAGLIRRQPWGESMVIIAATGWGQQADRHRSREVGFDHHLLKPVDPATLIHMMGDGSRR